MVEPGIATQDDFENINAEVMVRDITHPLRYHAVGIGSVVASGAFDRLRDGYLKEVEPTWVGNCTLCKGDVHTHEQFLRTVVDRVEVPYISHMVCEERNRVVGEKFLIGKVNYQARVIENQQDQIIRLETVLAAVRTALGNFGQLIAVKMLDKEVDDASSKGSSSKNPSGNIEKYLDGTEGWEAAEASHSDSGVVRGQQSPEAQPVVQKGKGPIAVHNFRVDDLLDQPTPVKEPVNNYKWPPEFRRYYEGKEPVIAHVRNCHDGPLGCTNEETNEEKYGLYGPQHSIATDANCISPSCE